MDALFIQAWPYFAGLAVLWLGKELLSLPVVKGAIGELSINLIARYFLPKDRFHRLKNVTLKLDDGTTTQIDHMFIARTGVFVVETKNMTGWIFGAERQRTWTQQIYRKKFKFQNPLAQNYRHIKAVEFVLDIPANRVRSVVVFIGGSTFKTPMPPNVTQGYGLIRYIKSFTDPVFSEQEVEDMLGILEKLRLPDTRATRREHIKSLKTRKGDANRE